MLMGLLSTLALGAVLMAAPATGMGCYAATRSVTVRLRDYARLDAGLLRVTEAQVSAIYAAIGVAVIWRMPAGPAERRARWPVALLPPTTDRSPARLRAFRHACASSADSRARQMCGAFFRKATRVSESDFAIARFPQ